MVALIIGNGFDLDLGLKTSYKDFIDSGMLDDKKNSVRDGLFQRIFKHYENKKWVDIEEELKKYTIECSDQTSLSLESPIDSYITIKAKLLAYIKKIDYSCIDKTSIALKLLASITRYADHYTILDFNYTNLHKIGEQIGLQKFPYKQVHGNTEEDSIIFGFDDNVNIADGYCCMIKSHSEHYRSININEILQNADEIVFFGHSLGSTDYHYFSNFFLSQVKEFDNSEYKKKTIRIFTYNEDSRLNILLQLRNMNNKRTTMLYDLNDFCIYRTAIEYGKDQIEINNYLQTFKMRADERRAMYEALSNRFV